jgi:hypothetical protein
MNSIDSVMNVKSAVIFLFIILFPFFNSMFGQTVISGRLIDEYYFPVPDVRIIVSNGGSVKTAGDGSFQIATTKMPYDLMVIDASNNLAMLYRGLYSTSPEITLLGGLPPRNVNSEAVKVEFPPVPKDRTALIKYVSNDLFYSESVTAFTNEKSKIITVSWPQSSGSVNGKFIYLEKSGSSYYKFSEKVYTVLKDFYPQQIKFDSTMSFIIPGAANITVYLPTTDYSKKGFTVSADFLSFNRNSELLLNTYEGDIIYTKSPVPLNLSYGFRLKVMGYSYNGDGFGFSTTYYAYPGSVLTIQTEAPPKLTAPQDKFYGANASTEFGYEWGSGSGVYVIHFHCFNPSGDYYVVTKEKFISSPLLTGASVLTGEEYSWSVSKYLTYVTIDDFVEQRKFINDIGYRAITQSETRTFRKKPY